MALSGGVGGARFLRGLARATDPAGLTVIGNVGDDVEVLGLHVSPDLDSILYALAGVADEERGWGRADETWVAFEEARRLGGESWFQLGDRDLGLHLVRTQALARGESLSAVTARLAAAFGIEAALLPATDDRLRTWIDTPAGSFPFQEWFVARRHEDEVDRVRFEGEDAATPAPGAVEAIERAELIVICPSNPFISIWPILAVAEIRAALERRRVPSIAVSPLVGGRAIKGPGRPDAPAPRRRHRPRAGGDLLPGGDRPARVRRVRGRRGGGCRAPGRPRRRGADADAGRGGGGRTRPDRARR